MELSQQQTLNDIRTVRTALKKRNDAVALRALERLSDAIATTMPSEHEVTASGIAHSTASSEPVRVPRTSR